MRSRNIVLLVVYFLIFLGSQILIFRNVVLFNFAFCFIYIGFILLIPLEVPILLLLSLAFFFGLSIDLFYDTMGIHAAATVLIAYMRSYIINFLTPRGGYDTSTEISIPALGFQWFVVYEIVMIFIHHLFLFLIESWGLGVFFRMIGKTIMSTLLTLFVFILFQYLFYPSKRLN